ncbi:MAG TPA: RHS repeat domain-containing protein, partial [Ktedonobacterales bacterium]
MVTTDLNGQQTTYTYDALGRMTSRTMPGETQANSTSWTYTDSCAPTGAQAPCVEIDETQQLGSGATTTSRAFYDGWGNLVETRDTGPSGQDIVRYRYYDPSGHDIVDSIAYFVPSGSGFSIPDATQPVTKTAYDELGRVTSATDTLNNTVTTSYSIVCNAPQTNDTACYEQVLTVNPLGHQEGTLTDAWGREAYGERYTGNNSGNYALYLVTRFAENANGDLTTIWDPGWTSATTYSYDAAGRMTGMSDPDRGTESYVLDENGNRIQSTDARGAAGTVYAGYDGLDRQLWRNTTNSPTGAYVTYSYDSTLGGNYGVGHLTGENFTGGPNNTLSGSYVYLYNLRGEQTSETLTVGSTSYPVATAYDDASNVTSQTYPDGETVTTGYTGPGLLESLTTNLGGPTTTLLSNATYAGYGGAGHLLTGAALDNGALQYSTSYDALLRLTNVQLTRTSDNATLYAEARTFD